MKPIPSSLALAVIALACAFVAVADEVDPAPFYDVGDLWVKIDYPPDGTTITGRSARIDLDGGAAVHSRLDALDLILLLDTSRSLKDTDPLEYRLRGAIALMSSLPMEGRTRVGVVGFKRGAEVIVALTTSKKTVVDGLRRIDRFGFTNLAEGIELAVDTFERAPPNPDASRVVVLFTDGLTDPAPAREAMQKARAAGVSIHTLLLGKDSDGGEILSEIATATGGDFIRVKRPEDLPEVFRNLRTTGLESVVVTLNGGEPVAINLAAGRFEGPLELVEGKNVILATATSLDGQVQSDEVTVWVRPQGCGELAIESGGGGLPGLSPAKRAVEIVYDSSGSMWGHVEGRPKYELAREALEESLAALSPDLVLSLRAYGHQHPREAHDCRDSNLLIAPGTATPARISAEIAKLRPRGQTPIAHVLMEAGRDLSRVDAERTIVLITDGVESCGGNGPAVAATLHEKYGVTIDVIGLGLDEKSEESDLASLREVARVSGGTFVTANDAAQLRAALTSATATPFAVMRDGVEVARGTLGSDETFSLAPGDYEVVVEGSPRQTVPITIESESRERLSLKVEGGEVAHSISREAAEYRECREPMVE